jgi:hypothetical protein
MSIFNSAAHQLPHCASSISSASFSSGTGVCANSDTGCEQPCSCSVSELDRLEVGDWAPEALSMRLLLLLREEEMEASEFERAKAAEWYRGKYSSVATALWKAALTET